MTKFPRNYLQIFCNIAVRLRCPGAQASPPAEKFETKIVTRVAVWLRCLGTQASPPAWNLKLETIITARACVGIHWGRPDRVARCKAPTCALPPSWQNGQIVNTQIGSRFLSKIFFWFLSEAKGFSLFINPFSVMIFETILAWFYCVYLFNGSLHGL